MSNPLDDEPAVCDYCDQPLHSDCQRYPGRCQPFMVAVVTDDPEVWAKVLKAIDANDLECVPICYRVDEAWFGDDDVDDAGQMDETDHSDAWGLPLVWDGRIVMSNCDRLVRITEVAARNTSHVPIRSYDPYDAPWHADKWARALGMRVVFTGADGGQEVTP